MKISDNIYMLEIPSITNPQQLIHPLVINNKDKLLLIDTGYPGQVEEIKKAIEGKELNFNNLVAILLTHQDIDHVGCVNAILSEIPNVQVFASEIEEKYINGTESPTKLAALEKNLDNLPEQAKHLYDKMKNFYGNNKINIDLTLNDGNCIPGFQNITVIDTPGHTPGHISLYIKDNKTLITGDAFVIKDNKLSFTDPSLNFNDEMYIESLKKLSNYDIDTVICYHGGIYNENVNQAIKELSNKEY